MISKEAVGMFKKILKKGCDIWVYTKGGTGGGNGELIDITDDILIVEGTYRGKKYFHYFVIDEIESIKIYKEDDK